MNSGISPITSELRSEACNYQSLSIMESSRFDQLCGVIDAVHAELERENAELRTRIDRENADALDADGVPWRVGDELVDDGMVCEVVGIGPNRLYYYVDATDTVEWTKADGRRHYHTPTVEDVLREFADGIKDQNADFTELVIAEYSKRLTLAGGAK